MNNETILTKKDVPTAIKNTLLSLMEYKKVSDIRVKEITGALGISRGTFYTYYDNLYQALEELEDETFSIFDQNLIYFDSSRLTKKHLTVPHPVIKKILEQSYEQRRVYCILAGPNGNYLYRKKCKRAIEEHLIRKIQSDFFLSDGDNIELIKPYIITGLLSLIETWQRKFPKKPVDEVTILMTQTVFSAFYINTT
jgi:AcrR family transcriptional regulator